MTANRSRRTGRPRLDAGERERLLAEIARLDKAPVSAPALPKVVPQTKARQPAAKPPAPKAEPLRLELEQQAAPKPAAPPAPPRVAAPKQETAPKPAVTPPPPAQAAPPAEKKTAAGLAAPRAHVPPPPVRAPEPVPEPTPVPVAAPKPAPVPEPAPTPVAATAPVVAPTPAPAPPSAEETIAQNWQALPNFTVDPSLLDRNLVITARRTDPAHGAFDVLRTRLVQALAEKGWRRVAITSPTAGCGKSFTAINLAVTLSRYDQCRTILLDMDMRRPGLAGYLGVRNAASSGDFLRGMVPSGDFLTRMNAGKINLGQNLALGLNSRVESYAAELFQQKSTADALAAMEQALKPEVVLFDLPPALAQDDVIAFRPHFDCILMVVGGGITTAEEVREATRRIGEDKPILGVVLNKAEVEGDYAY